SDAPLLRRTAPVVRDRRHVANRPHLKTSGRKRLNRGLAPAPGTLDAYVNAAHPHVERIMRALLRRHRRRKRRRLLRALDSPPPGTPPRHDVPLHVRDRPQGIVERRLEG